MFSKKFHSPKGKTVVLSQEEQQRYQEMGRKIKPAITHLRKTKGDSWPQVNRLRREVFEAGTSAVLTEIAREIGMFNRLWLIKHIRNAEMLGCNVKEDLINAIRQAGLMRL